MMIAAHTITSPNKTINIAPPALTASTVINVSKISISNRIVNRIIITTPFTKGIVFYAKKKRPCYKISFFANMQLAKYDYSFDLNTHITAPIMHVNANTIHVIGFLVNLTKCLILIAPLVIGFIKEYV